MELVVARKNFDNIASRFAEDDEILHQIENATVIEHALKYRL
jgi:hypothetical protein